MRIGFDLFAPSGSGGSMVKPEKPNADIAFMPLAIPLMFGPGAIANHPRDDLNREWLP